MLTVGISVYYLLHQISSPQEPLNISENNSALASKYGVAREFLENNSLTKEELRRIDIEDKQRLKIYLHQSKINTTTFYSKLENISDEAIIKLSEEYNLTPQETEELMINVLDQMENYPTLKDEDAFKMAKLDFMSYEDKINTKLSLPLAYIKNPPEAGTQVAFAISGSSPESFNALLEKQTGINLNNNSNDFEVIDVIKNVSNALLNSTDLELEKSICFIGTEKQILIRADYLISKERNLNYAYDLIVYGPNGKIISELSHQDKVIASIKRYTKNIFIINDLWNLPLSYPVGEYVLEYSIYDRLSGDKRMVRIPQKCVRQLLIQEMQFATNNISLINYSINQTNKFRVGEEMKIEFFLMGFDRDLKNEPANLKMDWVILDENNSIYGTSPLGKIGNITLNKNDVLPIASSLFIPENTPLGKYTLLLKVNDLNNNQTARSRINLEVIA